MKTALAHKVLHDTIFDMDNKYYTPTIEEFCVGFECEIKNSSGEHFEWEHFEIISVDDARISGHLMDWSFYDSRNAIDNGDLRVKFLDEVDLKDLGWKKLDKSGYELSYGATTYLIDNSTEFPNITDKWFLTTYLQGMTIDIRRERMSSYGDSLDKHSFRIKNKAELRRLMYQLEIIE